MDWSKQEKETARRAFSVAYKRECMAIAINIRKMADRINDPSDLWKIHDQLIEKRKEMDQKYDYSYSILLFIFARLICEGWISDEDLMGLSDDILKEIRRNAEFIRHFNWRNIGFRVRAMHFCSLTQNFRYIFFRSPTSRTRIISSKS